MASVDPRTYEQLARDALPDTTLTSFRASLLEIVQKQVPSDSATLLDGVAGDIARSGSPRSVASRVAFSYVEQYLADRERYDRSIGKLMGAMASGEPVIDTDVYTRRERRRIAIYREVLLPQGTNSILSAALRHRGRTTGLIVLKRHGPSEFGDDDAEALRRLLPAIALADMAFQYWPQAETGSPASFFEAALSRRESQIAELVRKGLRNDEIALVLGTSPNTVKKQVQRLLEKVGVSNRTELAGLIGSSPLDFVHT